MQLHRGEFDSQLHGMGSKKSSSHATYERIADKCEDLEKNISVTNGTKFFQTKEVQI